MVSSSKPSTTSKSESISLIITLDGPMDTNHPWLAETRTSKQHSGQSPIEVFHLIVPNSTEHIRLCIPETADKASSMAATTIYAHKLMLLAGKLDSEVRHRIEHPHALAEWIRQNLAETDRSTVQQSPVEWPLPLNQGIDDVYLSSESASHCSTDPEMGPATGEPPALNKRSLVSTCYSPVFRSVA